MREHAAHILFTNMRTMTHGCSAGYSLFPAMYWSQPQLEGQGLVGGMIRHGMNVEDSDDSHIDDMLDFILEAVLVVLGPHVGLRWIGAA